MAALLCGGCGSFFSRAPDFNQGQSDAYGPVYPGVRHDVEMIGNELAPVVRLEAGTPGAAVGAVLKSGFTLVDLPLSLVADTILLPFDLKAWRERQPKQPPAEGGRAEQPDSPLEIGVNLSVSSQPLQAGAPPGAGR